MRATRHGPGIGWHRRVPRWVVPFAVVCVGGAVTLVAIEVNTGSGSGTKSPFTVVYSVSGTIASTNITWYEDAGTGPPSTDFVNVHSLPWTRTTVVKGAFPTFTLTATAPTSTESGQLTCKITVNGRLRSSQSLTGAEPSVACDDSETGS